MWKYFDLVKIRKQELKELEHTNFSLKYACSLCMFLFCRQRETKDQIHCNG